MIYSLLPKYHKNCLLNKWMHQTHKLNHLDQHPFHLSHQSLIYLHQFWCFQNLLYFLPLFPHFFPILVIFSIIYTFLHLNMGSFIWAFFYYIIKSIPISFVLIICNISVYYTFIFILFYFFFLVIFFNIYTFLYLNRGSVIWALFY